MNSVEEVLSRAQRKIGYKSQWIKENYIEYRPGKNACYCALGALGSAATDMGMRTGDKSDRVYETAIDLLYGAIPEQGVWAGETAIIRFNDDPETTHEDVMRVFNYAIEEAKYHDVAN